MTVRLERLDFRSGIMLLCYHMMGHSGQSHIWSWSNFDTHSSTNIVIKQGSKILQPVDENGSCGQFWTWMLIILRHSNFFERSWRGTWMLAGSFDKGGQNFAGSARNIRLNEHGVLVCGLKKADGKTRMYGFFKERPMFHHFQLGKEIPLVGGILSHFIVFLTWSRWLCGG